jgi:hypothetical protein
MVRVRSIRERTPRPPGKLTEAASERGGVRHVAVSASIASVTTRFDKRWHALACRIYNRPTDGDNPGWNWVSQRMGKGGRRAGKRWGVWASAIWLLLRTEIISDWRRSTEIDAF